MDISEKYIEMCSKATEIQELRKVGKNYQEGDFFAESSLCAAVAYNYPSTLEYAEDGFMDQIKQKESHESWLPRQDQLQEMIKGDLFDKLQRFYQIMLNPLPLIIEPDLSSEQIEDFKEKWYKKITSVNYKAPILSMRLHESEIEIVKISSSLNSMEQLWLAFVMKEKYQKIWNEDKKEWINE